MKHKTTAITALLSIVALISFILLVVSLVATNPTRLGPGGVTFWFINLLLLITSSISIGLYVNRASRAESRSKLLNSSIRTGALVGFSLTLLVALSSLRSLSWRDIILLLLLVILVELYFRTRRDA